MRAACRKKYKVNTSQDKVDRDNNSNFQGRLNIVGIGPGDTRLLTQEAIDAINSSGVIVGYKSYIQLIKCLFAGQEIVSTGMTQEIKRAEFAINKALQGENVCLISSGDAGIYGMAAVALELLKKEDRKRIKINIIPGITAASGCAAVLGAPLAHDFAAISLSDLLTDRKEIEKKIEFASKADFILVFYNPKSKKRRTLIQQAWRILNRHKKPDTPVGIVRNMARANQHTEITKLKDAHLVNNIDMATTIIVGNSRTYIKDGYMVTPRGYKI